MKLFLSRPEFKAYRNNRGLLKFSESLALKAVSLLLSLILWVTILGYRREEIKKEVRLEPQLPPGMMIVNKIPATISFTLSGPRVMLELAEKRIQAIRLDLTHTRQATNGFTVTEADLGELPNGVRVTSIFPPQVLIRLEEVSEKYIPVRASISGKTADGYEVVEIKASPSKVAVSGPKGLLEALEFIGTEALNIEGVKKTTSGTVDAEVDNTQGFQVSRDKTVKVRVIIRKVNFDR
ncbi:MAG: YbbR-like domain-containing protein [Deltaproteobacteria bacterium]|nr:YbbR-like domain-containing protein [Deltaproteobacteria bacterium]